MEHNTIKITDVITTKYLDFLNFCAVSGKHFTWEMTNVDFVAFRTSSGQSREYVKNIQDIINNSVVVSSIQDSDIVEKYEDGCCEVSSNLPEIKLSTEYTYSDNQFEISNNTDESQESEYPVEITGGNTDISTYDTLTEASSKTSLIHYDEMISLFEVFNVSPDIFRDIKIETLDLSVRAINCLISAECITVADILSKTIKDLDSLRNMGIKSLNKIISATKSFVETYSTRTYTHRNRQISSS